MNLLELAKAEAHKSDVYELRDLQVEFGSLVDSPANKGARVMLFKRDSDTSGDILGQWSSWTDAVVKLAEKIGGSNFEKGLLGVIRDYPDVWRKFLAEHDAETEAETSEGKGSGEAMEKRMRDLTDQQFDELVKAERRRSPGLNEVGVIEAVLKSAEGRKLMAIERDCGSLTATEYVAAEHERAQLQKSGWHSWGDQVASLAKELGGGEKGLMAVREVGLG